MYTHHNYKDNDPEAVRKFISENPFAVLSGCDAAYNPVATQVPVLLEEREGRYYLIGHLIKGSSHHRAFEENTKVMMVFPGAHAYISATWYEDTSQASTWNYMSAQVTGTIRFLDMEGLREVLSKLTLHFENNEMSSPTVLDNLPGSYTDRLLEYIVGFEVEIDSMDHIFKLSQNRDLRSFEKIIEKLRSGDFNERRVAEEMENRKDRLFGN